MLRGILGALGRATPGQLVRGGRTFTRDAVSRRTRYRSGAGALDRSTRQTARRLSDESDNLVARLDDLDDSTGGITAVAGRLETRAATQSNRAQELLSEFDTFGSRAGRFLGGGSTVGTQLTSAVGMGVLGATAYTGINSIQETFGHQMSGATNTSLSLAKTVGTGVLGLRAVTHMRRARAIGTHVGPSRQMLNGLSNQSAGLHHSVQQAEAAGVQASKLGGRAGRAATNLQKRSRQLHAEEAGQLSRDPMLHPYMATVRSRAAAAGARGTRGGAVEQRALQRAERRISGVRRDHAADRAAFQNKFSQRADELTSLQRRQQSTSSRARSLASTGRQAMQKSKEARNLIRENATKIDSASAYKEAMKISTNRALLKGAGKLSGMAVGAPFGYGTMWAKDPAMQFLGKAMPVGFMTGAAAGTAIGITGMNKRHLGSPKEAGIKQGGRSFSNINYNATLHAHRRN